MNLLQKCRWIGLFLLWLVLTAVVAKPSLNPFSGLKRIFDSNFQDEVIKREPQSLKPTIADSHLIPVDTRAKLDSTSPVIPVDVTKENIFSFYEDKEVLRALKLAGVSLLQKAVTLGMMSVAWLLFVRSIGDVVKSVSSSLKYSTYSEDYPSEKSISESLRSYLKPNLELTGEELSLLTQCQLPSDIMDSLEQLGGLQPIKDALSTQYFVLNNDTTDHSIPSNGSVTNLHSTRHSALLYGPPGCGKTSLIRSFCRHIQSPLLEVTPSMIQHRFFGESTKTLKAIFTLAKKMKQCVIFIDELDALFTSRHALEASHDRSIKTEFMQSWDNLLREYAQYPNIFIFGATNRPQDIDPAILRRFEQSFHIRLPSRTDRMLIWQRLLEQMPFGVKDVDVSRCVQLTEGFSASDIQGLCRNLASHMLSAHKTTVLQEDIEYVSQSFTPTSWAASHYGRRSETVRYTRKDVEGHPTSLSEENGLNDIDEDDSSLPTDDVIHSEEEWKPTFHPEHYAKWMSSRHPSQEKVPDDTEPNKENRHSAAESPPPLFDPEHSPPGSDETGH